MSRTCGPREAEILHEMRAKGFRPGVIYEIGAAPGSWSESIHALLPGADYHLFAPPTACDAPAAGAGPARAFKHHSDWLAGVSHQAAPDRNVERTPARGLQMAVAATYRPSGNFRVLESPSARNRLGEYAQERGLPAPDVVMIDCEGQESRILGPSVSGVKSAKILFLEVRLQSREESPATNLSEIVEILRPEGLSLVELAQPRYDEKRRLCSVLAIFLSERLPERIWSAAVQRGPAEAAPTALRVRELARTLAALTFEPGGHDLAGERRDRDKSARPVLQDADVIVSHVEVNEKHGVGVLLQRMFGRAPNIIALRSRDLYEGRQQFGAWSALVSHQKKSRDAVFSEVLDTFGDSTAKRVLSVPFFPDDVYTAIAVKEIFGIPMCAYIMDDQNVHERGISDSLLRELLAKSSLRLAISPEIRVAYERKYGLPMAFMPPLAPAHLIPAKLQIPDVSIEPSSGVMIGNIWSPRWFELLRATVRGSGVTLEWCSQGDHRHLKFEKESLVADGIVPHEPPPDVDLVRILRKSCFAVLPSGTLDEADDRWSLSQFSLPSRLVYLFATSHIPVLVLGSERSAAARFVEQFGIGLVAGYERKRFQDAVREITQREINLAMRKRAFEIAPRFTDAGAADWLWQSLARGGPVDRRFEDLMPPELPDLSRALAAPPRAPQAGAPPEDR